MKQFDTWASKYRPKSFKAVAGQPDKALLWYMIKDREATMPPVLLFSGPSGVGKTTIARIAAAALNCSELENGEPCGVCADCVAVFSDSHPSVAEVNAAMHGGAEDMRSLHEQAYLDSGGTQVFLIDEAHSLSWQAWNVLLKLFEEPPAGVVFTLITSEPNKVPTKIRTRATRFDFSLLPSDLIKAKLNEILSVEEISDVDDDVLNAIIDLSGGSAREAIKLLEQYVVKGEYPTAFGRAELGIEFLKSAVKNDKAECIKTIDLLWDSVGDAKIVIEEIGSVMENLLLLKHSIPVYSSEKTLSLLRSLSTSVDDARWAGGMEVLSDWLAKSSSKTHLSFMATQFIRAFHGPAVSNVAKPQTVVSEPKVARGKLSEMLKGM